MQVEYHQEIVEATPKCVRTVCEAAGKDGWILSGMLAVMLPPVKMTTQTQQRPSGLLLTETMPEDTTDAALRAQMAASANQPTPAIMLMFCRSVVEMVTTCKCLSCGKCFVAKTVSDTCPGCDSFAKEIASNGQQGHSTQATRNAVVDAAADAVRERAGLSTS